MNEVYQSTIWCEKYRPKKLEDYICTSDIRNFVQKIIDTKEIPCILMEGSAGSGKTTIAKIIANETNSDLMYINGSMETSVDTIRYKVQQFCTTSAMFGGKKIVVIDELDRVSNAGMDSLKVLQEETESNARFIFCTNNVHKVIAPLQSRCQLITFGKDKTPEMYKATFKRITHILDQEKVEYDKTVIRELTLKLYPDIRKIINECQKFITMYGKITPAIISSFDDSSTFLALIDAMKNKKFTEMRKLVPELDFDRIYTQLYSEIDTYLENESKPNAILTIAEWATNSGSCVDKELPIVAMLITLTKECKFK